MHIIYQKRVPDIEHKKIRPKYVELESNVALNCNLDIK